MILTKIVFVVFALGSFVESASIDMEDGNYDGKTESSRTYHRTGGLPSRNVTDVGGLPLERISADLPKSRTKRSLSLVSMLNCGSEKCCRNYLTGYGNYCGAVSGSGEPIDDIDRCCQRHGACYDDCYDCSSWEMYLARYNWGCHSGTPYCHHDQYDSCRRQLCKCDTEFVKCLNEAGNNKCEC